VQQFISYRVNKEKRKKLAAMSKAILLSFAWAVKTCSWIIRSSVNGRSDYLTMCC